MRTMIPLTFAVAAIIFLFGGSAVDLPPAPRADVTKEQLSTEPMRPLKARLDVVTIGGVQQRCADCHALFDSLEETPEQLAQHLDIVLDHGLNTRCFNCHARENRAELELMGGERVPLAQAVDLCAGCHGTTFRDWEVGTHGRTMGSWRSDDPAFRRLQCIECHDPHSPAFPGLKPLPGPNTWRASPTDEGHAGDHAEDLGSGGPLRRWGLESRSVDEHDTEEQR